MDQPRFGGYHVNGSARSSRAAMRILPALAVAALVAGLAGAWSASPASADGLTNPKHFFWAPGQSPQGTVNSVASDLIYHGGNLGAGAIGVQTKPAVYLI